MIHPLKKTTFTEIGGNYKFASVVINDINSLYKELNSVLVCMYVCMYVPDFLK